MAIQFIPKEKKIVIKTEKKEGAQTQEQTITNSLDTSVADMVAEFFEGRTALHKLHLKVQGVGSFAAHKALNSLYDAFQEAGDTLAEQYQGATCILLSIPNAPSKELNTVQDAIDFLKGIKEMVTTLQAKMPYSEIVNELDGIKATINKYNYRLEFLK